MISKTGRLLALVAGALLLLPAAQAGSSFGLFISDFDRDGRHHDRYRHHGKSHHGYRHHKRHHRGYGTRLHIISPRAHVTRHGLFGHDYGRGHHWGHRFDHHRGHGRGHRFDHARGHEGSHRSDRHRGRKGGHGHPHRDGRRH